LRFDGKGVFSGEIRFIRAEKADFRGRYSPDRPTAEGKNGGAAFSKEDKMGLA
jgi:hypothetical protein